MNRNRWLDAALDRLLGPVPHLPGPQGLNADRRAAVGLWAGALVVVLAVFEGGFRDPGALWPAWSGMTPGSLGRNLYWAAWQYICYLAVPLAIILAVFRESPARYGLRIHIDRRTAVVYGVMVACVVPMVVLASGGEAFRRTYPFVAGIATDGGAFLAWEIAYVAQFMCLEFFFRGFLLFTLEEKLGYLAVGVSLLPYGLLHHSKPFPEALGALMAGTVLGIVALRTRSILGGVLVHGAVAVTMDVLVVLRA